MKSYKLFIIAIGLVLALMGGPGLMAQKASGNPELLVSTAWLEENLTDSLLVILQYGIQPGYKDGHIPGIRQISMKELIVDFPQGLSHELPDGSTIEQVLRSLGINNDSKIVISYGNENAIPVATRLFFTLDYAGLGDQVAVLNGGFPAWKNENRILTQRETEYQEGNIRINTNKEVLAFRNDVLANLQNQKVTIVDARPREQYLGNAKDHNADRRGHIEGAVNIPFNALTVDDSPYLFRPRDELQGLFEENHILHDNTIITYCGSGIWASPVYFTARLLGYSVRFYDASFQEWGNDESLPISTHNRPE